MSILVADDDAGILALIRHFLARGGFQVEIAANGYAAWRALTNGRHDLLITDYNMPGMTGIELVEKIRDAQMTLPVVVVSGEVDAGIIDDYPELDLSAVISKPFSPAQLLRSVNDVLTAAKKRPTREDLQINPLEFAPTQQFPRRAWGLNE